MKSYWSPQGLRLVGKAYEIRWQLRQLLEKHPAGGSLPLTHTLALQCGGAAADRSTSPTPRLMLVKG